jgi:hypothetical protein
MLVLISFLVTGCMDLAPSLNTLGKEISTENAANHGAVYTLRGGLGGIFSTGMSDLQKKLATQYHIRSASTIWYKQDTLSNHIIKQYRAKKIREPIILIGHSLGANEQIKVARTLGQANIPVALLITVDAVSPIRVSTNVKHAINLYTPGYVPLFSGLILHAVNPQVTQVDNIDISKLPGVSVNHFTIDKSDAVQNLMLTNVLAVLNTTGPKRR